MLKIGGQRIPTKTLVLLASESLLIVLGLALATALRFASDEELPGLVKRALEEQLSPGDIKRAIKNWVADDMRV